MMGKTHILAAWLSFIPVAYNSNLTVSEITVFGFFLMIGALLPDIDAAGSTIKKSQIFGNLLPLISFVSNLLLLPLRLVGWSEHREVTHSLLGCALLCSFWTILFLRFSTLAAPGFFLGYLAHLGVDALTKSGVPLFFPLDFRVRGVVKTGGLSEFLFLIGMGILSGVFFYYKLQFTDVLEIMFFGNLIIHGITSLIKK